MDYQVDKATADFLTTMGQRGMMDPEMVASLLKSPRYSKTVRPVIMSKIASLCRNQVHLELKKAAAEVIVRAMDGQI